MPLSARLARPLSSLVLSGLLATGVSACGVAPGADPIGAAEQAQIDPTEDDYVIYTLTNDASTQLGQVLVTRTANPSLGFDANTEYWYLNANLSNDSAVTFTGGSPMYWSSPPSGLGSLSFATARSTSWEQDYMVGTLLLQHNALTGKVVGLQWNMGFNGAVWAGNMTWYHNTPTNVLGGNTVTRLAPGRYNSSEYCITSAPL
jgi:hypothetical protein